MGAVIDLRTASARRPRPAAREKREPAPRAVLCAQCGERHPILRLPGGEYRCLTAFFDGAQWFCRNRGCRRAWLGED